MTMGKEKKNEEKKNKTLESEGVLSISAFNHICEHSWISIKTYFLLER